jgi:hypothetical protein
MLQVLPSVGTHPPKRTPEQCWADLLFAKRLERGRPCVNQVRDYYSAGKASKTEWNDNEQCEKVDAGTCCDKDCADQGGVEWYVELRVFE